MDFSMLFSLDDHAEYYGTWGKPGIYHVLNRCRRAGIGRFYYRTIAPGQPQYPSRISRAGCRMREEDFPYLDASDRAWDWASFRDLEDMRWISQSMDFEAIDHLRIARERTRELGMELGAWHEARTEDHWAGFTSEFVRRHPQYQTENRQGEKIHAELSFAYPEVMEYRLALAREVMAYEVDGIYFDFVKGGHAAGVRFDLDGIWCGGYEAPCAEAFQRRAGRDPKDIPNGDPEWVQFRADYLTEFMRRVRSVQASLYPACRVGFMGITPNSGTWAAYPFPQNRDPFPGKKDVRIVHPLHNLEDHDAFVQDGLVDALTVSHNCGLVEPEDIARQTDRVRAQTAGRCSFSVEINAYSATREQVLETCRLAREAGAAEIIYRESAPLWAEPRLWPAIREAADLYG